jgi:aryl-alcohol dehydrogenase-like predicted oxidoreductase
MQYQSVTAGDGTIPVSSLCLGTMNFGTTVDKATSFQLLDRFVEAGGTFLDTANCYASWIGTGDESELVLGEWIRSRGVADEIVLATKLGARPDPSSQLPLNAEGLSAKVVRSAAEASLHRLGLDRVNLCYAHWDDRSVPFEETLGAFAGLVADGLVDALGYSNCVTWRIERARAIAQRHGWPKITCVQQRHTYLMPGPGISFGLQLPVTPELLDYVQAEPDLTLLGYSPLISGSYTRPDRPILPHYDHPGTARRLAAVRAVADELGVTANQVVLAWMLGGQPPVLPVIGVSSLSQLDECLAAADLVLDDDTRKRLDMTG